MIPFKAKFDGTKIDTEMRDKLLSERDGIFNWLVQGARLYLAEGMGEIPKACEEATADYRSSNDVLGRFIEDCLEREFGQTVGVQETYDQYQLWCFKEKEASIPMNYFSKGMEERGIAKKKTNAGKVFVNCKLASDEPESLANDNWRKPAPGFYVYDPDAKKTPKPRSGEEILLGYDTEKRHTK